MEGRLRTLAARTRRSLRARSLFPAGREGIARVPAAARDLLHRARRARSHRLVACVRAARGWRREEPVLGSVRHPGPLLAGAPASGRALLGWRRDIRRFVMGL